MLTGLRSTMLLNTTINVKKLNIGTKYLAVHMEICHLGGIINIRLCKLDRRLYQHDF